MPTSRKRTTRPKALKGIPATLVDKAPASLSPKDKAEWARCHEDGRAGRPFRLPNQAMIDAAIPVFRGKMIEKSPTWARRAYELGRRSE